MTGCSCRILGLRLTFSNGLRTRAGFLEARGWNYSFSGRTTCSSPRVSYTKSQTPCADGAKLEIAQQRAWPVGRWLSYRILACHPPDSVCHAHECWLIWHGKKQSKRILLVPQVRAAVAVYRFDVAPPLPSRWPNPPRRSLTLPLFCPRHSFQVAIVVDCSALILVITTQHPKCLHNPSLPTPRHVSEILIPCSCRCRHGVAL
jgi:hypothetical protein